MPQSFHCASSSDQFAGATPASFRRTRISFAERGLQLARRQVLLGDAVVLHPPGPVGHALERLDQLVGVGLARPDHALALQLALGEGFQRLFVGIVDDAELIERDPQRPRLPGHRVAGRLIFGQRRPALALHEIEHFAQLRIAAAGKAHLARGGEQRGAVVILRRY